MTLPLMFVDALESSVGVMNKVVLRVKVIAAGDLCGAVSPSPTDPGQSPGGGGGGEFPGSSKDRVFYTT